MGIKNYITDKILDSKLKALPEAERNIVKKIFQENPELFKKIEAEIKEKKKGGMNEHLASLSVMKKYQSELIKAAQK